MPASGITHAPQLTIYAARVNGRPIASVLTLRHRRKVGLYRRACPIALRSYSAYPQKQVKDEKYILREKNIERNEDVAHLRSFSPKAMKMPQITMHWSTCWLLCTCRARLGHRFQNRSSCLGPWTNRQLLACRLSGEMNADHIQYHLSHRTEGSAMSGMDFAPPC